MPICINSPLQATRPVLAPECSYLSFADYKLLRNQFAGNIKFVPNALPEILAGRHVLGSRLVYCVSCSTISLPITYQLLCSQTTFDQMSHNITRCRQGIPSNVSINFIKRGRMSFDWHSVPRQSWCFHMRGWLSLRQATTRSPAPCAEEVKGGELGKQAAPDSSVLLPQEVSPNLPTTTVPSSFSLLSNTLSSCSVQCSESKSSVSLF